MKILYHISYYKPAFVYGGPTITTANLCEGLVAAGADVTVITTNANGDKRLDVPLKQAVDINGVRVFYYSLGFTSKYFYSPALLQDFASHVVDYDIVVLDALMTYLLYGTSSIAYKQKKPYIIPIRGQLFPWALKKNQLLKKVYLAAFQNWLERAAALHCTTFEEVDAVKHLGLSVPTFVIPNGMDTKHFAAMDKSKNLRDELGIPGNAKVLLQLGRLISIKRPEISIDVLSAMPAHVHLILAGPCDEEYHSELSGYAKQKSCNERLHFTGLLNQAGVEKALASADILLMPTEVQENFGMSAAEALAAGLAVVASNYIPVACWAAREKAAITLEANSATFSQAVKELLENDAYRQEMGQAAKRFAENKLDNAAIAKQTLQEYEAILARPDTKSRLQ